MEIVLLEQNVPERSVAGQVHNMDTILPSSRKILVIFSSADEFMYVTTSLLGIKLKTSSG